MKNTNRNDVHRPGLINPEDYKYLFSYSYSGPDGIGYNTGLLRAVRTGETQLEPIFEARDGHLVTVGHRKVTSPWGKLPFFTKTTGSQSGCDVCGAHYLHGDAWLHQPTGEVVLIGHMCADKMGTVPARGEWTANLKFIAQLRKTAKYQLEAAKRKAESASKVERFLANNPGLEEALRFDHYISRDLFANLTKWGSLSEKQVELAHKIVTQEEEKKNTKLANVPTGRVSVEGTVLSTKAVDTDFGTTFKMLVEVKSEEGTYKVFGTIPSLLLDSVQGSLKGCRVAFTAAFQPKEPGFGFFSRPTSPKLVAVAG